MNNYCAHTFVPEKKGDRYRQKFQEITSMRFVSGALNQLIEKARRYIHIREAEDLQLLYEATRSNSEEGWAQKDFHRRDKGLLLIRFLL